MFGSVVGPVAVDPVAGLAAVLGGLDQDVSDQVRIDRIRALEELKAAAAAAQARETAAFVASQRAAQAAAGVPAQRIGRGIAGQVGLARRISPYQADRYVGWAMILTGELPETFAALAAGRTTERRALTVARETVFLSREHRRVVDADLAPRLERLGDRGVEAQARALGYRLDPAGYLARSAAAEQDRRVSLRPAPEVMCRLTALLPAAQGVACYAALTRHADTHLGDGDGDGRGQLMADTLVERLTGQVAAADVPVEICLTMTDRALIPGGPDAAIGADDRGAGAAADDRGDAGAGGGEVASLHGYGPIPAEIARRLVFHPSQRTRRWLRRLYTSPDTGELVAMDSRRRCFTPAQRRYIELRDHTCRTPWCDAPIRHIDHVLPYQDGGPTSLDNAQGYCATCNLAKQAPAGTPTSSPPAPSDIKSSSSRPPATGIEAGHPDHQGPDRADVREADRPRSSSCSTR